MTKEEFSRLDADEQMFIIDNHLEDESLETVRDLAKHWDEANYLVGYNQNITHSTQTIIIQKLRQYIIE